MIEVAIPLAEINKAAAAEKQPGIGAHPRGLHLWWARRPLTAARAVIFCQMVDDPSSIPEEFPSKEDQERERMRLFSILKELIKWENFTNKKVLEKGRQEIKRSWNRCCIDNANHPEAKKLFNPDQLPEFHDPFSGGGALPLEAQRLGMKAFASDLNPVAVLINKAMIEIPPQFANMRAINPNKSQENNLIKHSWKGADGLAEDVRYYGEWMLENAKKNIGHLYPKVKITPEILEHRSDLTSYKDKELTVLTWIWARTVKSQNPAFSHVDVPLVSTFMLSNKNGKEYFIDPIIKKDSYRFTVKKGKPKEIDLARKGTSAGKRAAFKCLLSQSPLSYNYIRAEGKAGRIGLKLMAIIAKGNNEKIYLPPSPEQELIALQANPYWSPELSLPDNNPRDFKTPNYGFSQYSDLFSKRQLTSLSYFSDLITAVQVEVKKDAINAGLENDDICLNDGGIGSKAYSEAIAVYLSFAISRLADYNSSITTWKPSGQQVMQTYKRQAIPMTWDFPESNVFATSSICWSNCVKYTYQNLKSLTTDSLVGSARQQDAQSQSLSSNRIVSTDPPYYDNIGYAQLSDFFYIWLRHSLKNIFPKLFATVSVPKAEELIASSYKHGDKEVAEKFFLNGMTQAMNKISILAHEAFPLTIYYAFKQSETKNDKEGKASTGWEAFLEAVQEAGLSIKGTWPIRTELANRMIGSGTNALASSIILVCQKRDLFSKTISRNEFRRRLREELPKSIRYLESINIAPVDIAQAAIGPGMSIYTNTKAVLNSDDSKMTVREALIEINSALDEYLSQDESDFDSDTRFALTFFESYKYDKRDFGDAEGLAKARNVSVEGVAKAGIISAKGGKVYLLSRDSLDNKWQPNKDDRLCVWEATQHLIKRLESEGESSAANLLTELKQIVGHNNLPEKCRSLAYRLYNHCESTNHAEEARSYNGLIIAWPELEQLASIKPSESSVQTTLI